MEGSTVHKEHSALEERLKIAGPASSLFSESTQSPFDSLFSSTNTSKTVSDSKSSTQHHDSASSFFENYNSGNEHSTTTTQTNSYYGYSSAPQFESDATSIAQHNTYYNGHYSSVQANGINETSTNQNHDYTGSGHDNSLYATSQYYYSQQQYYYDPSLGYYYDPNHYDPNQNYDSNQNYGPNLNYDSNQNYDQNQTYNPNQTYDPNQTYYPNQTYDPNQAYNSNQAYDSNQTDDLNQTYDPNQTYDSSQYYQYGFESVDKKQDANHIDSHASYSHETIEDTEEKPSEENVKNLVHKLPRLEEKSVATSSEHQIGSLTDIQTNASVEISDNVSSQIDNNGDELTTAVLELSEVPLDLSKVDDKSVIEEIEFEEIEFSVQKERDAEVQKEELAPVKFQELSSVESLDHNLAAVTSVETIELNQDHAQLSVTSIDNENELPQNSTDENNESNGIEVFEEQEVNITHGDDHDIFEYQPRELEIQQKSDVSLDDQLMSTLVKENAQVASDLITLNEQEEINTLAIKEPEKLDDLDDLILGSATSKPSEALNEGIATNAQEELNISREIGEAVDGSSELYQYNYTNSDYSSEQWGTNDANKQYQNYDPNQTSADTNNYGHWGTSDAEKQYQIYDPSQTAVDTNSIIHQCEYGLDQSVVKDSTNASKLDYSYKEYSGYDVRQDVLNDTNIGENQDIPYSYYNSIPGAETVSDNCNVTRESDPPHSEHNAGLGIGTNDYGYYYQNQDSNSNIIDYTTEIHDSTHQYSGYDQSQIAVPTNPNETIEAQGSNYQYSGYEQSQNAISNSLNETALDQSRTAIDGQESIYHYPVYDQSRSANTTPQSNTSPISPTPKLVNCVYPQCTGENNPSAKFCSECGRPVANSSRNTTPATHYGESNYHPKHSMSFPPYALSQGSHSTSSFASFGYHSSSPVSEAQNASGLPPQWQYNTEATSEINDPLGRTKGHPVVAFGFGGKIFTMFPRTVQRFTSSTQNMPITKYAPGVFKINTLKDIISLPGIEEFPGPLLMDNNKGGVKAKKKQVLKYLDDQLKIFEDSLGTFVGEKMEKKKLKDSIIVWNILKIMFENEGALFGSSKVEEAVRSVLVPSVKTRDDDANFTVPADNDFDSQQSSSDSPATPPIVYTVSPEAIDTMQGLLLKGDRVAAINHAMNENLWAHALIIASCVNKEQWKEVVSGFVRHELGSQNSDSPQLNGRESLRVLYSLFAGHGQNSVKHFLPQPTLLNRATYSSATIYPNHQVPNPTNNAQYGSPYSSSAASDSPLENLERWRETLAMILANRSPGDNQAITALGDMLKECGWIHAAHIWYEFWIV
ncbi:14042_t:CDS:2 [Acaulospora colombiana]|uniref:14042_t:CDS:1 n=1 Tax=Acaulospora colombiana TaxID=27376 RepID=A0ACA9LE51_9GLOM|nr:14042_t:CDS:2 [Acaulospora colombiana]